MLIYWAPVSQCSRLRLLSLKVFLLLDSLAVTKWLFLSVSDFFFKLFFLSLSLFFAIFSFSPLHPFFIASLSLNFYYLYNQRWPWPCSPQCFPFSSFVDIFISILKRKVNLRQPYLSFLYWVYRYRKRSCIWNGNGRSNTNVLSCSSASHQDAKGYLLQSVPSMLSHLHQYQTIKELHNAMCFTKQQSKEGWRLVVSGRSNTRPSPRKPDFTPRTTWIWCLNLTCTLCVWMESLCVRHTQKLMTKRHYMTTWDENTLSSNSIFTH